MTYAMDQERLIISETAVEGTTVLTEAQAACHGGVILYLNEALPADARPAFRVSHESQLGTAAENEEMLWERDLEQPAPPWLTQAIAQGRVISVNCAHGDWRQWLERPQPKRWRVHAVGLGDVGGILLTGLRLLGQDTVSALGLYDPDPAKCARWHRELGQICVPFQPDDMTVEILDEARLFDCDLFVFCASRSVPPLDQAVTDVRMVQYEGNAAILGPYARRAVTDGFRGIFAVVSDPVDQLCRFAQLTAAETAAQEGLRPMKADQFRGYGLGVMNGRASWYARQDQAFASYLKDGRAYGPHGQGLIIANSLIHYNDSLSRQLTERTLNANLEVRSAGFKPYVAPALSSGAISLLCTLRGEWHYSAVSLGEIFMGCRNRLLDGVQETECARLPVPLQERILETGRILRRFP